MSLPQESEGPPRVVRLYIIPLFVWIFELFYLSAYSETSIPSNHTNKLAELCLIASVFKDPSRLPVRFREFFHNSQFLPYPPFNSPGASLLPLLTSVNKLTSFTFKCLFLVFDCLLSLLMSFMSNLRLVK